MGELIQISGCGGRSACKNQPSNYHTCPYQEDVNNDSDYQCTCCKDCEYECAMDI